MVNILRPKQGKRLPLVISTPHVGTSLPNDIKALLVPSLAETLPDTDWHVQELYRGLGEEGATLIFPTFSRYVVDLNRSPDMTTRLYSDNRFETTVVPTTTFAKEPLYADGLLPTPEEIQRRLDIYYKPYHEALLREVNYLRRLYPHVLLLEGHSIARHVPSIQEGPFPDLIVGDGDGSTCNPSLSAALLEALKQGHLQDVSYNHPFKGGYITRFFGKPETGISALQLEMSQDIYLEKKSSKKSSSGLPTLNQKKVEKLAPFLHEALLAVVKAMRLL